MFKKKMKTYPLTAHGYAQMELDTKMEKQEKINGVTSAILLLVLMGFGLLSKDFLILYFTSKGAKLLTKIFL